MNKLKARFIEPIGTRAHLRIYWDGPCAGGRSAAGRSYHNAMRHLLDVDTLEDWSLGGIVQDHPEEAWPNACDHCGDPVPDDATRQVFRKRLYATESGLPEPGDLYYVNYNRHDKGCIWHPNCDGRHLMAVLPNGHEWDIDNRASNCTLPDDATHRCWVRHGTPPDITVDKNGHTCNAGAGSIQAGSYHGFLRGGYFVTS